MQLVSQSQDQIIIYCVTLFPVNVDDDRVKADWLEAEGQFQVKRIADHYGIYEHLFGYAFFIPRITLDIKVIGTEQNSNN